MKEIPATQLARLPGQTLDAAVRRPIKIVTGPSRYGARKPLVIMSEERYLALKAVVEEAKKGI